MLVSPLFFVEFVVTTYFISFIRTLHALSSIFFGALPL